MKNNRPNIHFTTPFGWINDPNGLCYFGGKYHMFYQHYPYASRWGTMHWGHAVSDDMLNWTHLPIALFPTKMYDKDGCFSGSGIEVDGKLHMFYTSIAYVNYNPENIACCGDKGFIASQSKIVSEDGYKFDNLKDKKLVVAPIEDEKIGSIEHTRDPKVWKTDDGYRMVLGTKVPAGSDWKPQLLFYKSNDLENWELLNTGSFEGLGNMWECPDIFKVGAATVLAFSPENCRSEEPVSNSVFGIIDFDESSCQLSGAAENFRYIDDGLDYYAPQSFTDKNGIRTQIGWLRMGQVLEGENWIGMMSLPREIKVVGDKILTPLHPEIAKKFSKKCNKVDLSEQACLIKTELVNGEIFNIGNYKISFKNGVLICDRTALLLEKNKPEMTIVTVEKAALEIVADKCVIEVYVNGGERVISHVIEPLCGEINAEKEGLTLYTM